MGSPLDFISSDGFRKKLITRNLTPYAKSPNRPTLPVNTEYVQSDTSVQDSPDQLIDIPSFANQLYPLNQYGNEGGYEQVPDPGALLNTKSNEGEYGFQDANIIDQSLPESQKWKPLNVYSNGSQLPLDSAQFFTSLGRPITTNTSNNQPYPTTFVPSRYSPLSILLSNDPIGSNGLLSQDSFIVKLGAQTLRREFEARIATQIRQDTIGRANILNVNSGTDLVNILAGVVPIIEPNFTITVTANPILAAANFALRLGGSILPVSPIPGSYFDPNINPSQSTTIQQMTNAFRNTGAGRLFNRLLGGGNTGSQIMYNNMGAGQRSRLFRNIDYNRYKPNFERSVIARLAGAIVGTVSDNSNYYVGNITSEPSRVFSPGGDIPVNAYGQEVQAPVYGPQELAQLYEGPSQEIRLGANGPTYSNGGGIEGGFTWVSPKYRGNAGKKVGVGGEIVSEDEDFRPSSYNSTESTQRELKQGSILDQTQRIIDSQPQGGRRLQHVGNAIDQVSKVFHDGYKELTKGSKVLSYVGEIGQEVGSEYCRVFAKDTPYLQYNDLQKVDGITVNGRRFSDSVLDNTYNLNIAPNKQEGGQNSTNIIGTVNNATAKKYMFSLENLAWRTSNSPGFSVSDLPVCERGPNGGRVMWFPPYGLTFNETVTTNWNPNDFLGRPEPIYTYKNTSRGGSISWKIVVDHPSALNVIVNKVLSNETNKVRIDGILESFFAGCRKYDLYELAKKYYTVNPNDLFQLQQAITSKEMTPNQLNYAKKEIQSGNGSTGGQPTDFIPTEVRVSDLFKQYVQIGGYFDNDSPIPSTSPNYTVEYNKYISPTNVAIYTGKTNGNQLGAFFNTVVTPNYKSLTGLTVELATQLERYPKGTITIRVNSSCSAPASISYNKALSQRRIDSLIKFFNETTSLQKYIGNSRLKIIPGTAFGEETKSQPKKFDSQQNQFIPGDTYGCSDQNTNFKGGDTKSTSKIYSTQSMACRRAFIESIEGIISDEPNPEPQTETIVSGNQVIGTVRPEEPPQQWEPRDNITKRVVRALISECDYFETIKSETPMVYDNLKDKLKFFQPSFHSTTPEGLNSRLTFLQQCMRPGDTIPTIKEGASTDTRTLQYDNATNTAFGAPPVLILRIGDFYNTKILPTSLALTYEQLDLNPEGIGVQPMIANVTLSFNFVGGSGLKESVDKLQNALTFNYYANTEVWDERADTTTNPKELEVFDKQFLSLALPPNVAALNQANSNAGQSNNSSIGNVLTSSVADNVTTGTISYSDFMSKLVADTQTYFTNVVNKNKEINAQYNNAVRQQWMLERNYTEGNLNVDDLEKVIIFGKPTNIEKRVDIIFKDLVEDVLDEKEGFIEYLRGRERNFNNKVIRAVKQNYQNLVNNKRASFQNAITNVTQGIVDVQQSYIQTLARVNIITYRSEDNLDSATDGYQVKSGPVVIYSTSGTTNVNAGSTNSSDTLTELIDDVKKVQTNIKEFNEIIWSKDGFIYPKNSERYEGYLVFNTKSEEIKKDVTAKSVFIPFSKNPKFENNIFRRVYMIISDDVLDDKKYETFKNSMIGNIINNQAIIGDNSNDISSVFDEYWINITKPIFLEESDITKSFIEDFEKNKLNNYIKYTPFDVKTRVFDYTTNNIVSEDFKKSQESMIKGLASTTNQNTKLTTWNDSSASSIGAYISKAKLN